MKSTYMDVMKIRRMVFSCIARIAYEDEDLSNLYDETYKLLPGEVGIYRENIFRERAVIGESMRMALGLDARTADETGPITEGIDNVDVDTRIYHEPLVSVIKIACEACPETMVYISNNCRKCLAHPCMNLCPKNAISRTKNGMIIDQEKCIRCRRCVGACPYNAIIETGRPCADACGVRAITSDYLGRAQIEHNRCVACGQCISACPFGAIADNSEIYQLIKSIKHGHELYAIIAPSFAGQFGPLVTAEQIREAIKLLGIKDMVEVGLGADLTTMNEAKEFLETVDVPGGRPYMGTSCCYSWKLMVKQSFPSEDKYISDTSTPMVYTAKHIKEKHPDCKIVFIGPCVSKKLEALQDGVKEYVDFVITFEELMGMFLARDIEPGELETKEEIKDASYTGRRYGIGGGVAAAVVERAKEIDPDCEIDLECADGLFECVKLLRLAKAGKKDCMLLEGMACEGGCIGGPGTVIPLAHGEKAVNAFAAKSPFESPFDNTNIPNKDKP